MNIVKKNLILPLIALTGFFASCDDNTDEVGFSLTSPTDRLTVGYGTFYINSETVKLDNAAGVKALIQAAVGTSAVAVSMDADGATFSGSSLIGDLSIQAPNRGNITTQVQYQGTGAITKTTT